MSNPEYLSIFVNDNWRSIDTLLQNIKTYSVLITRDPEVIRTDQGITAFSFSFKFIDENDINYNGKIGHIVLDVPVSNKIIRPLWNAKIKDLESKKLNSQESNSTESSRMISFNVMRDFIYKHMNVRAEYFSRTDGAQDKIHVYAVSDSDDLRWGARLCVTIEKEPLESLFRNCFVVPAKITNKPFYRLDMTPTGFQVPFEYLEGFRSHTDRRKGHSVVDANSFGGLLDLFNSKTSKELSDKIISVYLATPVNNKNVVLGIGSYEQYLKKYGSARI